MKIPETSRTATFSLNGWIERFPEAEVYRFPDAGHYVVEDAGS